MPLTIVVPLRHFSWLLLLPAVVLMGLGILAIYAVEPAEGVRQMVFAGTGLMLMFLVCLPKYETLGRYSYWIFGLTVLALAATYVLPGSIAPLIKGSRRWIRLGPMQVQPSEFAKVAYILALAWYLRWRRNYRRLRGLIVPTLVTLIPVALILKQPDLGTALIFLPAMLLMLLAAGAKFRHFVAVLLLCLATVPLAWPHIKDYQQLRIVGWLLQSDYVQAQIRNDVHWDLGPWKVGGHTLGPLPILHWKDALYPYKNRSLDNWKMDEGYQVNQSKVALGSGGLAGQGWSGGVFVQYEELLPERHNDFVLAVIGHQWGLWGSAAVVLCYLVLTLVALDIATRTNDPFGRLLVVGTVGMLMVQAFLNVGMVIGLLPVTGTALPFVSAGGSSMWANCIALGLIQNINLRRPMIIVKKVFAFEE